MGTESPAAGQPTLISFIFSIRRNSSDARRFHLPCFLLRCGGMVLTASSQPRKDWRAAFRRSRSGPPLTFPATPPRSSTPPPPRLSHTPPASATPYEAERAAPD